MRGAGGQLAFDFGGNASTGRPRPVRKVRRDETVRLVEYAPFPRIQRDQQWRHGFTLDLSSRGLCVRAKDVAPTGSLLRIILRNVDGQLALDCVARVAWSAGLPSGSSRMGLEVVARKGPRRVRRETPAPDALPARIPRSAFVPRIVAPPLALVHGSQHGGHAPAAVAS